MKKLFLASLLLITATSAHAGQEAFEACLDTDPTLCAMRVMDNGTGKPLWLVPEASGNEVLRDIWGRFEDWAEVPMSEYQEISALIPEGEHMVLPAKNPTTSGGFLSGLDMSAFEGRRTPATGSGKGGKPGVGPLVETNINVNIGTGSDESCRSCHTGNSREIHKRMLEKKGG